MLMYFGTRTLENTGILLPFSASQVFGNSRDGGRVSLKEEQWPTNTDMDTGHPNKHEGMAIESTMYYGKALAGKESILCKLG